MELTGSNPTRASNFPALESSGYGGQQQSQTAASNADCVYVIDSRFFCSHRKRRDTGRKVQRDGMIVLTKCAGAFRSHLRYRASKTARKLAERTARATSFRSRLNYTTKTTSDCGAAVFPRWSPSCRGIR
jgi:hypothetical protein